MNPIKTMSEAKDFLKKIDELKAQKMNYTAIAKHFGISTLDFRRCKTLCHLVIQHSYIERVKELASEGNTKEEIAEILDIQVSDVRAIENKAEAIRLKYANVANASYLLISLVTLHRFVDISSNVMRFFGFDRNIWDLAVYLVTANGFAVYYARLPQISEPMNKNPMIIPVLCNGSSNKDDIYKYHIFNPVEHDPLKLEEK